MTGERIVNVISKKLESLLGNEYAMSFIEECDKFVKIQDKNSGKYCIYDRTDFARVHNLTPYTKQFIADDACSHILKCQYHSSIKEIDPNGKVSPFLYHTRGFFEDSLFKSLRKNKKTSACLYFRGRPWARRARILTELSDICPMASNKLQQEKYYEELSSQSIALALPGFGENCFREYECFAVGTPVMMFKKSTEFYHPLIPNHHYIEIAMKSDECITKEHFYIVRETYHNAMKNKEFLAFVKNNAIEYFDKYINGDYQARLICKICGIGNE